MLYHETALYSIPDNLYGTFNSNVILSVRCRNNCLIKIPQFAVKVKINSNVCGVKQTHLQNGCSINQNTIGSWYVSGFLLIIGSDRNEAINPHGAVFRNISQIYAYKASRHKKKSKLAFRDENSYKEMCIQLCLLL